MRPIRKRDFTVIYQTASMHESHVMQANNLAECVAHAYEYANTHLPVGRYSVSVTGGSGVMIHTMYYVRAK